MNKKVLISLVVIVLFLAAIWFLQNLVPNPAHNSVGSGATSVGKYLTDPKGRALYTFDKDGDLKSTCAGECLVKWPLYEYDNNEWLSVSKDSLTNKLNVIKRDDGFYQYAYGSKPLYYYAGDFNPGDRNGDGINGVWHLILLPN